MPARMLHPLSGSHRLGCQPCHLTQQCDAAKAKRHHERPQLHHHTRRVPAARLSCVANLKVASGCMLTQGFKCAARRAPVAAAACLRRTSRPKVARSTVERPAAPRYCLTARPWLCLPPVRWRQHWCRQRAAPQRRCFPVPGRPPTADLTHRQQSSARDDERSCVRGDLTHPLCSAGHQGFRRVRLSESAAAHHANRTVVPHAQGGTGQRPAAERKLAQ